MSEIEQKVSELGAKVQYLEKKVHESNGWVEYKKLVLANQEEAKEQTKILIEKVMSLESRVKSVEEITNHLKDKNNSSISKEEFTEIKELVHGNEDKPGMLEVLRFFRSARKLYWWLLGGLILLLAKEYIIGFMVALQNSPTGTGQ